MQSVPNHAKENLAFWNRLSCNPALTYDIVAEFSDLPWNWYFLSINRNISYAKIIQNIDKPWCILSALFSRSDVPFDDIVKAIKIIEIYESSIYLSNYMFEISRYAKITINDIRKNMTLKWCWAALSQNVSYEEIRANPDLPWCETSTFMNPSFPIDILYQKAKKNATALAALYMHPDFTYQLLIKLINKRKHVTWEFVSKHPRITFEHVCISTARCWRSRYDWNWQALSANPNITINIVKKNPHIHWDFSLLSENMHLDIDQICNNKSMFDWIFLAQNRGIFWSPEIASQVYRRHLCAIRIQRAFRRAIYDPSYLLYQIRLKCK